MKKKLLLLVMMLLLQIVTNAHDIAVKKADGVTISYNWINDHTELVVTYRGNTYSQYENEFWGNIIIPEPILYKGETYRVTNIGTQAFDECSNLTSVTITSSVMSIGDHTFFGCKNLTSLTIPNSMTNIIESALLKSLQKGINIINGKKDVVK